MLEIIAVSAAVVGALLLIGKHLYGKFLPGAGATADSMSGCCGNCTCAAGCCSHESDKAVDAGGIGKPPLA